MAATAAGTDSAKSASLATTVAQGREIACYLFTGTYATQVI